MFKEKVGKRLLRGPAQPQPGRVVQSTLRFAVNVPVAELWPLLSNTQRLNQSLGLPDVRFQEQQPQTLALRAEARLLAEPSL